MTRWFAFACGVFAVLTAYSQIEEDEEVGTWKPISIPPGRQRADIIYSRIFEKLEYRKDFLFHDGQYWECIGALQVQQGMYPEDGDINSTLVWMLGNVEREDLAFIEIHRFRQENPDNIVGALTEAEWCSTRKLWTRIPPILERLIAKSDILGTFVLLERAYMEMGQWHEAMRILLLRKEKLNDRAVDVKIERLKKMLGG